jgi:hypothetical protein
VSLPFFLPLDVISLTISEEFHSVIKTGKPSDINHLSRR